MKKFAKTLCFIITIVFLANTFTYAEEPINSSVPKDMLVQVKYISENKGGTVAWNGRTQEVTVKLADKTLVLKLGSNKIISNGKTKNLKDKVIAINGRTMLPVSVINQELGIKLTNQECIEITGVKFIELLKAGQVSEISGLLSRNFSKYLKTDYIAQLAEAVSGFQFDVKHTTFTKNTVHQNLSIPVTIQQTNYNYIIRFDYDGKIDDLGTTAVQPPAVYQTPSYEGNSNYTETEVTFGSGTWKLPATLTLPEGNGPFPVVILVHGSGPNDRDESVGALKPFRDLAQGLASKNIAVLRYEKRTWEYSTKMSLIGNITMHEETEQDVFAAAEYLKTVNKIDPSNIIVLGHSLGGYALPEILKADTTGLFKAGIIMSGCTRPIYQLLQEQYAYFMNKGMISKQQYDYIKGQVDILDDPAFDAVRPPENYTLGNAYYYSYMKTYDVLGDAAKLNMPILVLQGERDYQVSAQKDFEAWKKAFGGNPNAEFKLYPKLNHMYTEGVGDSLPDEYYVSKNIPQYVINDISSFIEKTAAK